MSKGLILTDTTACNMRDELLKARRDKKITLDQITKRLSKMEIPLWLQSQILQMRKYREYDRITCPVELAMEAAVNLHILNEIMDAEKDVRK